MVVAPMRAANWRSAAGGIASSLAATRYQDGSYLPGRDAHHVGKGGSGQRLLHRVHDPRLDRGDVSGEVVDEVVLGQPARSPAYR